MEAKHVNIVLEEEVQDAIAEGKAVVALESTIISHGMTYPVNLDTAKKLESIVRQHGAIPATCAIIEGRCKVGLSKDDLEILSTQKCLKLSTKDIAYATAFKKNGATTVAATMFLAQAAGIEMFGTGGIGGVHRVYSERLDISADLIEMSRTNVSVVSAGCKSILDIPNTIEYLETMGVPVIGFGTESFPAFYSRESGEKVNYRLDSPEEIALFITEKRKLDIPGSVLIANPVDEEFSLSKAEMDELTERALREADLKGLKGKELTPFLLAKLAELSAGRSLSTNVELVKSNVRLASQIAVCLSES